jgi:hypothetical protein
MKPAVLVLLVAFIPFTAQAQSTAQTAPAAKPPAAPATQEIETEKIGAPVATPPPASARIVAAGSFEPAQVKALLHKLWLTEFRINDLLTQLHPDKWSMTDPAQKTFGQTIEGLHQALASQEEWRAQFDVRPDNMLLGFETFVAISLVLPRVESVAHNVAQYENPSFGSQFSQAASQLLDLQQFLQPHLASLLKNQDGVLQGAQAKLAACQNQLGFAMHSRQQTATPMKNIAPEFKGRHVHHTTDTKAAAKTPKSK